MAPSLSCRSSSFRASSAVRIEAEYQEVLISSRILYDAGMS